MEAISNEEHEREMRVIRQRTEDLDTNLLNALYGVIDYLWLDEGQYWAGNPQEYEDGVFYNLIVVKAWHDGQPLVPEYLRGVIEEFGAELSDEEEEEMYRQLCNRSE